MSDASGKEVEQAWEQWRKGLSPASRLLQDRLSIRPYREPPGYWLVEVDEEQQEPTINCYSSLEQLTAAIRNLPPTTIAVPFFGHLLRTTQGLGDTSLRFLVMPDGRTEPLFSLSREVAMSDELFYAKPAAFQVSTRPAADPVQPAQTEDGDGGADEDSVLDDEAVGEAGDEEYEEV